MKATRSSIALLLVISIPSLTRADKAASAGALATMPVKEVTIFKDGHALMLHEGSLPTDAAGNVMMDYLPTPVMGTFWPYSTDKAAKLAAVIAAQRRVAVERTALTLRDLIEANVGAEVILTEEPTGGANAPAVVYEATIEGVPVQTGEEQEADSPPGAGQKLPIKGNLVLFKTQSGVKAVDMGRILDVTFKNGALLKGKATNEEMRNLLTLKLDWSGKDPAKKASVGMMYLQKGLRWIPEYKVAIDGKGSAVVKLNATIINELADLDDVTASLVVGVPGFAYKDMLDPIALQQQVAQLSHYFENQARSQNLMSNSMMTQVAVPVQQNGGNEESPNAELNLGPDLSGSEQKEDLFIYTVKHLSLKKGSRAVVNVAEFTVPYKDIYRLEVSFTPPAEVRQSSGNAQQDEVAKLLAAPKVMHNIRLTNKSGSPFTTGPALVLQDDRLLAQGMMTFTPAGAEVDVSLTAVVDVQVTKTDRETKRTPEALTWEGHAFGKVDLSGSIKLTNFRGKAMEIEVVRNVLGDVDASDKDSKAEKVNVFEEGSGARQDYPYWWSWYAWPYWWHHVNGMGRITWNVTVAPGKGVDLGYAWHYYWRQ